MSYNQEELISILNSIVEICSSSDTLIPIVDGCRDFLKFDDVRQKYYSFMGNREKTREAKEIISADFTDLEQLVMNNAKKLKDICLEHKDDEEFHPLKSGDLWKLFTETHDGIRIFEVLLTVLGR